MGSLGVFKRFSGRLRLNAKMKAYPFGYIQRRSFSDSKIFINGNDTVLPVLIVGAGPVGLVLSILLTKLGIFLFQTLSSLFFFFFYFFQFLKTSFNCPKTIGIDKEVFWNSTTFSFQLQIYCILNSSNFYFFFPIGYYEILLI